MTTLALAEKIGHVLSEAADVVDVVDRTHQRIVYRVRVGKQIFIVTCEESAPDKRDPAV